MSAAELLSIARTGRPNVRYAMNRQGTAIGAWVDSLGRYVPVAGLLITGEWASLPYEIIANGEPMHKPEDWLGADGAL